MKKLILSAAFLAFAGLTTVKANSIVSTPTVISIAQDSTVKTPVKIEELPDPVKTTLSSDKYKEWAPTAAFLVTATDKTEWYQIDVKKGEEVASLNIGKDGVVVQ
jgi:type V secretory pathway adhesin AidA